MQEENSLHGKEALLVVEPWEMRVVEPFRAVQQLAPLCLAGHERTRGEAMRREGTAYHTHTACCFTARPRDRPGGEGIAARLLLERLCRFWRDLCCILCVIVH